MMASSRAAGSPGGTISPLDPGSMSPRSPTAAVAMQGTAWAIAWSSGHAGIGGDRGLAIDVQHRPVVGPDGGELGDRDPLGDAEGLRASTQLHMAGTLAGDDELGIAAGVEDAAGGLEEDHQPGDLVERTARTDHRHPPRRHRPDRLLGQRDPRRDDGDPRFRHTELLDQPRPPDPGGSPPTGGTTDGSAAVPAPASGSRPPSGCTGAAPIPTRSAPASLISSWTTCIKSGRCSGSHDQSDRTAQPLIHRLPRAGQLETTWIVDQDVPAR